MCRILLTSAFFWTPCSSASDGDAAAALRGRKGTCKQGFQSPEGCGGAPVYLLGISGPYCPVVWDVLIRTSCSPHLAFE